MPHRLAMYGMLKQIIAVLEYEIMCLSYLDVVKRMYLSPMMQHFFNNVPIEELIAGRSIHHPGALRKVSTPICTYIRYIYIMLHTA